MSSPPAPTPPIRVGLFQVEKDAFGCFASPGCTRPGAEAELVQIVLRILNIPYTIVDLLTDYGVSYDFGNIQANGSWSGVMRLLTENKIDMCGLSMRITEQRNEAIHFSYPTRYFQSIFVVNRPSTMCPRTFILDPFSPATWSLILSTLLICLTVSFILNVAKVIFGKEMEGASRKTVILAAFQGAFRFPSSCSPLRSLLTLNATLLFMMFVVTQIYQSKMYAFLASENKYHVPFYNLKQALDRVESGQSFFTAFDSQSMLCSTNWLCRRFDDVTKKREIRRRRSQGSIEDDIDAGGIYQSTIDSAFLSSRVTWLDKKSQDRIIIRDEEGMTYYVAFSFSTNNKKLRDRFNTALMQVLPAVPHITGGHGYDTMKRPFQLVYRPTLQALSFNRHLSQLFKFFGIGIAVCFLSFIVEIILHRIVGRDQKIIDKPNNNGYRASYVTADDFA